MNQSPPIVDPADRRRAGKLFLDNAERVLQDPKLSLSSRVRLLSSLRSFASVGAFEPKQGDPKALPETVASSLAQRERSDQGDDATGSGRAAPA